MRRARITYEGALHHAMNRGINGEHIFVDNVDRDGAWKLGFFPKNLIQKRNTK